jgi:hypothetical protein
LGTKLVEAETGYSVNEPVNYAVRAAIEQGIIELVHEGNSRDMWKFVEGSEGIIDTKEGVKKTFPEVFSETELKETVPDIN